MIKHDFKQSYKTRQFASWFIRHLLVNPARVLVKCPQRFPIVLGFNLYTILLYTILLYIHTILYIHNIIQ